MGYREVSGSGLSTRYAGTPALNVKATPDGPVDVEICFQAESARAGEIATFTRLLFVSVLEYRWIAADHTFFTANRDDFEFALIEIVDSDEVKLMTAEGMYSDRAPGQRLGGVVDERNLHHFRIGFDDYGTFNIISMNIKIDNYRQVN